MMVMDFQNKVVLSLLLALICGFTACGLLIDGTQALTGFYQLQSSPAKLVNDFFAAQGVGAALLNSSAVAAIGLVLVLVNKIQISGTVFSAVFTLAGFGLFGKTPLNIIPIFVGVYLAAKFADKRFQEYILIALFGSALGPLVSFLAFELGFCSFAALALALVGGVAVGFLLPAVSLSMLHFHQGYNLYNVGLSCGFLGLFITAIIKACGKDTTTNMLWYEEKHILTIAIIPVISLVLVIAGLPCKIKKNLTSLLAVQTHSGRLPSDFIDKESLQGTLLNCGLIGLIGSGYAFFVGADFNGPVIGGLLTIIGFAAFGAHLKNSYPIVCGVLLAAAVFSQPLSSPAVILAAIFCVTLAPIAGQFGVIAGIAAGFIHLTMVLQTADWNGGFNLYNNGFAGGLTATLIIAIIQWYKSNKTANE